MVCDFLGSLPNNNQIMPKLFLTPSKTPRLIMRISPYFSDVLKGLGKHLATVQHNIEDNEFKLQVNLLQLMITVLYNPFVTQHPD